MVDIIRELSEINGWSFQIATIKFRDDRALFQRKIQGRAVYPCSSSPDVSERDIIDAQTIVGQMGAEPFLEVLKNPGVDIIVAGRSYDPAPFAAFSMSRGVKPSPAWHMGKIMECGGLCSLPKGRSMLATMYSDRFELTPPAPEERCTPLSVAAHTFYEKSRPDRLPGPGGMLHLDNATYRQQPDGRTVLVRGSEFHPTQTYQVKLEGVKQIGFRTIFVGGIRDPILIGGLDDFLLKVRQTTQRAFSSLDRDEEYQLLFHVYGQDAVMGHLESATTSTPHEVGLMGEVLAPSQEEADSIAGFVRVTVLHGSYKNQLATGGNLASPLTPLEQPAGPVFKFTIYNLVDVESPLDLFTIDTISVGSKTVARTHTLKWPEYKGRDGTQGSNILGPYGTKVMPRGRCKLADIASVIRSKNSGPFEITLDVLFDNSESFRRAQECGVLDRDTIKRLYGLENENIVTLMFYEPALGWKCTFQRGWPSQGSFGEKDTFGCQQHAPLLSIDVPAVDGSGL
jgi:hypothetical protein